MPRWSPRFAGPCLALLTLTITGCDSVDFVPSPPEELRETNTDAVRAATPASIENPHTNGIELILARRPSAEDLEGVLTAVRTQAGLDKVRLKVALPEDFLSKSSSQTSGGSTSQAARIRQITTRHPQALVLEVENAGDADVSAALNEARAAGIMVVVAGPAPEHSDPAATTTPKTSKLAPLIVVAPNSFAQSATDLVSSAVRNAKNAGISDRKSAVILETITSDSLADKRAAAIKTALAAAGISDAQTVRVAQDPTAIQKKLIELLKANSKIGLVFALDLATATAVARTLDELIPQRPFVASTYTWDSDQIRSVAYAQFATVADYSPLRVLRKAITVAATAIQRHEAPKTVDIAIPTHDSPADSKLSQSHAIVTRNSDVVPPK
jgi:hypothetical protein